MKWAIAIWIVYAMLCIVGTGGLVWAAIHFISKYW